MKNPFYRRLLKSKIHRATVTEAELNYVGSITIDERLMNLANLVANEEVDIYNITNGERLTTYVIPGPYGKGDICINGAAAHKCQKGDKVIIASYLQLTDEDARLYRPEIVHVNEHNQPIEIAKKEKEFSTSLPFRHFVN